MEKPLTNQSDYSAPIHRLLDELLMYVSKINVDKDTFTSPSLRKQMFNRAWVLLLQLKAAQFSHGF